MNPFNLLSLSLICGLFFLGTGCAEQEKGAAESTPLINENPEKAREAPAEKSKPAKEGITGMASKWSKLTEKDGKKVIFEPCDASNTAVKVDQEQKMITYMGGQEAIEYPYSEAEQKDDGSVIFKLNEGETISVSSPNASTSEWDLLFEGKIVMTHSDNPEKYEVFEQPCLECWGPEECDEMEN